MVPRAGSVTVPCMFEHVTLDRGYVLAQEGGVARQAFIILDGEAEVFVDGRQIATIGPGEVVGDIATLDKRPWSATVRAATEIRVLALGPGAVASFGSNRSGDRAGSAPLGKWLRRDDEAVAVGAEAFRSYAEFDAAMRRALRNGEWVDGRGGSPAHG